MSGDPNPDKTRNNRRSIYRRENRVRAHLILTEAGIPYVSFAKGCHLIVADVYEFWPGTGRWKTRTCMPVNLPDHPHYEGRGVFELIQRVKDDIQQT